MRKRMPSKRYLLIAFALLSICLGAQQISSWSNSNVYHYRSLYKQHLTGYGSDNIVAADWGKLSLEMENRYAYTDRVQENRQERENNRLQLGVGYHTPNLSAQAFYRHEWFARQTGWIMPYESFLPYLEDDFTQSGISFAYTQNRLNASLNARYRLFSFKPVFDFGLGIIEGENLKADAQVAYNIIKPLAVYVDAYQKTGMGNAFDTYDLSSIGAGLLMQSDLSPIQHLEMQSGIDWLESDAITADRLIPITSRARYSRMLSPMLTGFASYEIRNFYDRENAEMLFNSQFLRLSGKYTPLYDLSNASYIELGGKLSPRGNVTRKSSALFTHAEMKVLGRFYLGGGISHMLDRYTHYEALARYFFTPVSEIHLGYVYSDDIEYKDYTTYTSAGLRLLF